MSDKSFDPVVTTSYNIVDALFVLDRLLIQDLLEGGWQI